MNYAQALDRELAEGRKRRLAMYREVRTQDPAKARALRRLLVKAEKALAADMDRSLMLGS